jgi:hypothetical protein
MGDVLKFLQINLHHAKGATDAFSRRFICDQLAVGLLQEPWAVNGSIKGLQSRSFNLLYCHGEANPRAAMVLRKDLKYFPLTGFFSRDFVAVGIDMMTETGPKQLILASAYFPGDQDLIPTEETNRLIDYCHKNNLQYIIGCDANAHNVIWGSTDTNGRGEILLEYLSTNKVDILNVGNKPTFITAARREVLDLTLASPFISNFVSGWHVSEEPSLSDHRQIRFDLDTGCLWSETYRIPKLTNWELFFDRVGTKIESLNVSMSSPKDLEIASNSLNEILICSYEESCAEKTRRTNRSVPWWNSALQTHRKKLRRTFNRAKRTNDWETYRKALTDYNLELRRAKRRTFRTNCEGIEELPEAVRLQKSLSKDHSNGLGQLKNADGTITNSLKETHQTLLGVHFPGSNEIDNSALPEYENHSVWNQGAYELSCNIFTEEKVRWAVNEFNPYKSPGPDQVFPVLLQKSLDLIAPYLVKIFRASYSLGYIPQLWRKVKVVFIPKGGDKPVDDPKAYRPISLSSFLLKTMETN